MLKRLIITILALVLVNSAINLVLAGEHVYKDSENVYNSTQNGNETTKKDTIIAINRDNDQDSGHYDSIMTLDERIEAWEWY